MSRKYGNKQRRFIYLAVFLAALIVEIYIGVFVRDNFIRPYVGDILVTVLLCCLCRVIFLRLPPAIPVFLVAVLAEVLQSVGLAEKLGLQGTVIGIILGSTFDWKDILCYALGCIVFAITEGLFKRVRKV